MNTFNPALFSTRDETFSITYMFDRKGDGAKIPAPKKASKRYVEDGETKTITNLFGYRGKRGCFSAVKHSSGEIGLAVYDCAPEDVTVHDVNNACYFTIDNVPGWGHEAVKKLKTVLSGS